MIGKTLYNRYEILEHLGDGSTATVYKAVDSRLGRLVALKILLPHVRSTTRSRFFQEAHAAAQLVLGTQAQPELDHRVVEERHAQLERRGHRHLVGLEQQVVDIER